MGKLMCIEACAECRHSGIKLTHRNSVYQAICKHPRGEERALGEQELKRIPSWCPLPDPETGGQEDADGHK